MIPLLLLCHFFKVILGGQLWKHRERQQRNRSCSQPTPPASNGDTVWGGGEFVPLLTCHCKPSRPILLLINGAVCWASQEKTRAAFSFTEAPFICPQQMGPLGPTARLHLMCSASFILISEQVPERSHMTYRGPLWLVHLHKVTLKNNGSLLRYCQLYPLFSFFRPHYAGGQHAGRMTDLMLPSYRVLM